VLGSAESLVREFLFRATSSKLHRLHLLWCSSWSFQPWVLLASVHYASILIAAILLWDYPHLSFGSVVVIQCQGFVAGVLLSPLLELLCPASLLSYNPKGYLGTGRDGLLLLVLQAFCISFLGTKSPCRASYSTRTKPTQTDSLTETIPCFCSWTGGWWQHPVHSSSGQVQASVLQLYLCYRSRVEEWDCGVPC